MIRQQVRTAVDDIRTASVGAVADARTALLAVRRTADAFSTAFALVAAVAVAALLLAAYAVVRAV
jgi:hypothetical protein